MVEKVVTFQLGSGLYGVSMQNVISIERIGNIINVPQTPEYLRGIFELRGEIIPIVDLRTYLLGQSELNTEKNRIIIVSIHDQRFGIIVDQANDIIDVPENAIEKVPIHGLKIEGSVNVANLNDKIVMMIDIEKLFSNSDIVHALEEVRKAI